MLHIISLIMCYESYVTQDTTSDSVTSTQANGDTGTQANGDTGIQANGDIDTQAADDTGLQASSVILSPVQSHKVTVNDANRDECQLLLNKDIDCNDTL